jgi:predicted  nucleic acid-binding Zn-ribbon protein
MSGPIGQPLDHYLADSFDVIAKVHDNLAAIRAVADHLTPVEDLLDFQEQIVAVHGQLALLVQASTHIVQATPAGLALLKAIDASTQRMLLELGSAALRDEEYFATAATVAQIRTELDTLIAVVDGIVAELPEDIATHGVRLAAAETTIADHETRLDALEPQLGTIGDDLSAQVSALQALTQRIAATEDGIVASNESITALTSRVTNAETGQEATNSAVQALQTLTQTHGSQIEASNQALTSLELEVDDALAQVNTQASNIQALDTRIFSSEAEQIAQAAQLGQLGIRMADAETGLVNAAEATTALTTRVEQTENSLVIASEDITRLESSITSVGNLLPNSGYEADTFGWEIFNRGSGWGAIPLERDLDAATAVPTGCHTLSVQHASQPAGALGIKSPNVAVERSKTYMLSGYTAALGCTSRLEYRVLDAAGQFVEMGLVGETTTGPSTDLQAWDRVFKEILVPADGRMIQLQWWVDQVAVDPSTPKAWLLRPMLEEMTVGQISPSPWTDSPAGITTQLASAVQSLTTQITELEGEITAVASASTELATRVGTVETALVSEMITSSNNNAALVATTNQLSAQMDDVETGLAAQGAALSTLQTDLSTVQGTVTSHSSSLTSLQSQVDAMDQSTGGSAAAIAALDTRVTQNEADIDSHSSAITSLQNSVTSANKIFAQPTPPATAGRINGDLWFDTDNGNKPYVLTDGSWVPRQDLNKNTVFVGPTQPTATAENDLWIETDAGNKMWRWNGTTWVDMTDTRITAAASAITALESRATSIEGVNTSQGSAITTLQNSVNNPTTGLAATASAVNSLTTRVTDAEGDITATANSVSTLTTTVNGHTSTISQHATSINGLKAGWGVTLDVNGYVSGLYSVNNGTKADFTILATNFKIVTPGKTPRTLFEVNANGNTAFANDIYFGNGRIVLDTGTYMKVQGIGFGVGNEFIEWFGPKMAITACARSNAISYATVNGDAYYGGSLTAGLLRNAVSSSSTTMIGNQIINGPFNTNGNTKSVVISYTRTWRRTYNAYSSAGYQAGSGSNTATIQVYRKIGSAAETLWHTFTTGGNTDIINEPDGPDGATLNWSGSVTLSDADPSVEDRTYRAIIVAATTQTVTRSDGNGDSSQTTTARLSIISTEE